MKDVELKRAEAAWDKGDYGRDSVSELLRDVRAGKFRNADPGALPELVPAPAPFTGGTALVAVVTGGAPSYLVMARVSTLIPAPLGLLELRGPVRGSNDEAVRDWNAAIAALGPLLPPVVALEALHAAQAELLSLVQGGGRSNGLPLIEALIDILDPPAAVDIVRSEPVGP